MRKWRIEDSEELYNITGFYYILQTLYDETQTDIVLWYQ